MRVRERQLDYRHKLFLRILAVMSAPTTSFLGVVLVTQPQVPISAAREFFDRYYGQVTQVDYRKVLYSEDLSRDFQESVGSDWEIQQLVEDLETGRREEGGIRSEQSTGIYCMAYILSSAWVFQWRRGCFYGSM